MLSEPTSPQKARSGTWFTPLSAFPAISLLIVILLFWQFVLAKGLIPSIPSTYLGSPAGVFESFRISSVRGTRGRPCLDEVLSSLRRVLLGFAVGAVLATPLGLLMGYNKFVGRLLGPFFSFLRPVPALAFIPVMLIWFGISDVGRVALIAMTSFLYIVLATSAGVASVPKAYHRAAQNYRLSSARVIISIILPASLPSILTGFRTAWP